MQTASEYSILIHYGELGLKGQNQKLFRRQLQENLQLKLRAAGLDWAVKTAQGCFHVPAPGATREQAERAVRNIADIAGIAWAAWARKLPHRGFLGSSAGYFLMGLEEAVVDLARSEFSPGKTFCVRAHRAWKALPFTGPELEHRLGALIRKETDWDKVNLRKPDFTFHLEIQQRAVYLFGRKVSGPGGLPVGTAGRVLVLLSGGIDSPVAAYLLARRGCRVDFLHFTATAAQQEAGEQNKVWRLARTLSRYTGKSRLFLVPYTQFDVALLGHEVPFDLVLFRRFMLRVAERLAQRIGADALATGDNLSQVASQTITNLVSTDAATDMTVFRPLVGFNKDEIIQWAERIGTYADAIEPYKDCCALISHRPRTRSKRENIERLEREVFPEYEGLIQATLAEMATTELPCAPAPAGGGAT